MNKAKLNVEIRRLTNFYQKEPFIIKY